MNLNKIFKKHKKEEQKDLENRSVQFMQEYKVIRARYRCDFQAFIRFVDAGEGGMKPMFRIIDSTKAVEAEEAAEKIKEESKLAIEEKKVEGSELPKEEAKESEPPKNENERA